MTTFKFLCAPDSVQIFSSLYIKGGWEEINNIYDK